MVWQRRTINMMILFTSRMRVDNFKEVRKGHLVVVLFHVGSDLSNCWRESKASHNHTKFVNTSDVNRVLGAVLREQEEGLAERVDVLLREVFQVLGHV